MTADHPALAVLQQLDTTNMAASAHLFAEVALWHYSNPNLPDLNGDYVGPAGISTFFAKLAEKSQGTCQLEPVSATPVGPELVVVQSRNTLTLEAQIITVDVVVVWRVVAGRIQEVWDIVPGQPTEIRHVGD